MGAGAGEMNGGGSDVCVSQPSSHARTLLDLLTGRPSAACAAVIAAKDLKLSTEL